LAQRLGRNARSKGICSHGFGCGRGPAEARNERARRERRRARLFFAATMSRLRRWRERKCR
jgi:hypothetical protein